MAGNGWLGKWTGFEVQSVGFLGPSPGWDMTSGWAARSGHAGLVHGLPHGGEERGLGGQSAGRLYVREEGSRAGTFTPLLRA